MKSIAHLADSLGVTPAIIRSWQINLNLDHPRYQPDDPVYNADWEHFFQEVARLRKEGHSFGKIRTVMAQARPAADSLPAPGTHRSGGNGSNGQGASVAQDFQAARAEPHEALPSESSDDDLGIYGPPKDERDALSFSFSSRERRKGPIIDDSPPQPSTPASIQAAGAMQNPASGNSNALVQMNADGNLPSVQHLQNNMHEALIKQDLTRMAQTYVQLMENYQILASRYSESSYLMGQLEEKSNSLEERLKEKDERLQEKEQHHREKEREQVQRIQELEAHLETLKSSLHRREDELSQHQDKLVTREQITDVEQQLKMLAVSVFQQQEEQKSQDKEGFWQRIGRIFGRS